MRIIEKIFEQCYVIEPRFREDSRGIMEVFFDKKELSPLLNGFEIAEQRIYRIPKKHTFFGIHYQKPGKSKGKLISVVQGKAMDYIVDLRKDSSTYRQYKMLELDEKNARLVFFPAGFGHGFLTLEDNTIQAFAIDSESNAETSGLVNFMDPGINLAFPHPLKPEDIIISDYDKNARNISELFQLQNN